MRDGSERIRILYRGRIGDGDCGVFVWEVLTLGVQASVPLIAGVSIEKERR